MPNLVVSAFDVLKTKAEDKSPITLPYGFNHIINCSRVWDNLVDRRGEYVEGVQTYEDLRMLFGMIHWKEYAPSFCDPNEMTKWYKGFLPPGYKGFTSMIPLAEAFKRKLPVYMLNYKGKPRLTTTVTNGHLKFVQSDLISVVITKDDLMKYEILTYWEVGKAKSRFPDEGNDIVKVDPDWAVRIITESEEDNYE